LNHKLYEINTRVWLKQFGGKLCQVPVEYYENLANLGITAVWLMGIWKTCDTIITECCFSNDLISSYQKSLKNWNKDDVIGSPYSIDSYEVNSAIGTINDLQHTRKILNDLGISLILDYVPNHFGAMTRYIKSNPEVFLSASEEFLQRDSFTFYKPHPDGNIFAHGRDPLFPAWTDTIQVNYFSEEARRFMTEILKEISDLCDGIRCDMAMLPLNNVFYNSWVGVLNKMNISKPTDEFWQNAIKEIKKDKPEFLFIAETYWDLEWDLQQLGFDFTYDKRLTDRLASSDMQSIKAHLYGDISFQRKSVRFLENHDEARAVTKFGKYKSLAAAAIVTTIPGMKLYYDGQFTGKRVKLPVQLGREPVEKESNTVKRFYNKILSITKSEVYDKGNWQLLEPRSAGPGNYSYDNLLVWQWSYENLNHLVIINYSENTSQCRLKFPVNTPGFHIELNDLLSGQRYVRLVSEINDIGMFIELKAFQAHLFEFYL
jgi:glycosidase